MSSRNARIVAMVKGGLTRSEVARQMGISRERVRQIVKPILGKSIDRARAVTDAERDAIIDLAKRGLHAKGISEVVGRSIRAVVNTCARSNVQITNGNDVFGDELRRNAVDLVAKGMTYAEVANRLGMTRSAVAGACHRHKMAQWEDA